MTQSVPPGGFSMDILEEPSEFSDDLLQECPTEDVESVLTPPPAKKPALMDTSLSLEDSHTAELDEPSSERTAAVESMSSADVEEVAATSELPAGDRDVAIETESADRVSMETSTIAVETKLPPNISDVGTGRASVEEQSIHETCEDEYAVGVEEGEVDRTLVESITNGEKLAEDVPAIVSEDVSRERNMEEGLSSMEEVVSTEGNMEEEGVSTVGSVEEERGLETRDREVDGSQVKSSDTLERERIEEVDRKGSGREVADAELMALQVEKTQVVVPSDVVGSEPGIMDVSEHRVPGETVLTGSTVSTGAPFTGVDNTSTTDDVTAVTINATTDDANVDTLTGSSSANTSFDAGSVQVDMLRDDTERELLDPNSSQGVCISEESLAELQELETSGQYTELDHTSTEKEASEDEKERTREKGSKEEESASEEKDRVSEEKERASENVLQKDDDLVAVEHQLTHRLTQAPDNITSLTLSTDTAAVAQAATPVGLLGALHRRFRQWRVRNRRFLMFGFGFLTVASLLFLGVNFFYDPANDAQTKRPPVLH